MDSEETSHSDLQAAKNATKPPRGPLDQVKRTYRRFLKLRGEPREVALGFALGLFVGMSPTMGFQTLIAVPIAALLGWNTISAAMGVWISNPLTAPVLYGATYLVGAWTMKLLTGHNPGGGIDFSTVVHMIESTPGLFMPLVVGGVIVGIPITVLGYYLSLAAVNRYRERIRRSLSGKVRKIRERRKVKSRKRRKGRSKRRG